MSANPAVMLLPGLCFSTTVFEPLQSYCQGIFRIVVADYDSDSFEDWLLDCKNTLPEKVHLVGWSLGGLLAWKLAQNFPQRVLSVVTFSTSPRFLATNDWPGVLPEHWAPFLNFSQQAKMQQQLLRLQGDRSVMKELRQHQLSSPLKSWQWGLEMLAKSDEREWLLVSSLPKKFVLAQQDMILPTTELASAVDAVILPNAGHASVYTHAQTCAHLLQDFWYEL